MNETDLRFIWPSAAAASSSFFFVVSGPENVKMCPQRPTKCQCPPPPPSIHLHLLLFSLPLHLPLSLGWSPPPLCPSFDSNFYSFLPHPSQTMASFLPPNIPWSGSHKKKFPKLANSLTLLSPLLQVPLLPSSPSQSNWPYCEICASFPADVL